MTYRKVISIVDLKKMKEDKKPITMVTAYDYPSALCCEEAGVDIVFVGDTVGMVVLGYDSTIPVTLDEILHHTKAVTRGAKNSFVLADMPFLTYHGSIDVTLQNAGRLMQEGGAKAVKMEGGTEICHSVKACVQAGIPVMGHIGLTPQAVNQIGGFKIQGRSLEQAQKLIDDAKALEQAGAFAIVLEMVPEELAQLISEQVTIPTIGIGAGRGCDGQVLVYHDLLQYASPLKAKFLKTYANIGDTIVEAISTFKNEVQNRQFPAEDNVFHMNEEVIERLTVSDEHVDDEWKE
ncbi:3-methyl-2-oxobutanoate hydroxymethyltransferase [Longirhabdus pacifica]|uniref:3-methyl-2-oxobutanoate hydroxymethyltransferase n=1 Tax=Longirhabdus pacifica TaxID=2305227 RepID=UPI0010087269|nr:3-methyl-2-oxobutanoate hydroxymethyltransferase [Longirhabdus pacifica]